MEDWVKDFPKKMVHIDSLCIGDTVIHDGVLTTLSNSNLKHKGFCGTTICGDSYRSGSVLVEKVLI